MLLYESIRVTWLVYVCSCCVPIATLNQNKRSGRRPNNDKKSPDIFLIVCSFSCPSGNRKNICAYYLLNNRYTANTNLPPFVVFRGIKFQSQKPCSYHVKPVNVHYTVCICTFMTKDSTRTNNHIQLRPSEKQYAFICMAYLTAQCNDNVYHFTLQQVLNTTRAAIGPCLKSGVFRSVGQIISD